MIEQQISEKKCACCGSNLDRFVQPVILSILAAGPQTGYALIKRMPEYSTFAEGGPDPTGIYRYLKTMRLRGLIFQEASGDTLGAGDRQYHITDEGRTCLGEWVSTLRSYSNTIQALADEIEAGLARP